MKKGLLFPINGEFNNSEMVVATGEFRCPHAGEWYLSGAIVEGYKTFKNLNTKFWIAKKVIVEKIEFFKIIEEV